MQNLQESFPCGMFIQGEYWGQLLMTNTINLVRPLPVVQIQPLLQLPSLQVGDYPEFIDVANPLFRVVQYDTMVCSSVIFIPTLTHAIWFAGGQLGEPPPPPLTPSTLWLVFGPPQMIIATSSNSTELHPWLAVELRGS